ncbi:hypothetical protein [Hyphomicrobium sp. DY-1]|uniref:hypothetical protein n=1 Tax=Hyphomicrobium sp. DY-1 TaxID=3075650 RepID=UPI0039C1C234
MRVTDDHIHSLARKLIALAAESGPRDLQLRRARLEATLKTFSGCAANDIERAVAEALHAAVEECFSR